MKKLNRLIKDMHMLIAAVIPIIATSMSGLLILLTDGLCLARYSEETLAASGPAAFNASLIITLFTGIVGITRIFVGQANGNKNARGVYVAAVSGISLSVIVGIVLILIRPLILLLPELSSRPDHIIALEKEFLGYVPIYGFFVVLNTAFSSILNGCLKFKQSMLVGVVINVLNIILTIGLVFGYYGFPETGIAGSALSSLISSIAGSIIYIFLLHRSKIFKSDHRKGSKLSKEIKDSVINMIRIGSLSGCAQSLDEAAQTIFVWIVGSISIVGLMANNIALSVNYIMVIPLSGLGIGASTLIANKIGDNQKESVKETLEAAFLCGFIFVFIVFIFEYFFAGNLADLFLPDSASPHLVDLVIQTIIFLFSYGIGFVTSMIFGGALEAVGLSKYILYTRLLVEYALCLPIIFFVVRNNIGNDNILRVCWLIYSFFELLIGIIYGVIFKQVGLKQEILINSER